MSKTTDAIVAACKEVIDGKWHEQRCLLGVVLRVAVGVVDDDRPNLAGQGDVFEDSHLDPLRCFAGRFEHVGCGLLGGVERFLDTVNVGVVFVGRQALDLAICSAGFCEVSMSSAMASRIWT